MSKLVPTFESAIYKGFVGHRRLTPTQHQFENKIFMLLLKVDEIPLVLKSFWQLGTRRLSWARFRRADYIGESNMSVTDAVKIKIAEKLNTDAANISGDVFMLVHLRYLGFYFSPLNLYYVKSNGQFTYMLAEVSNTPWHEKHYYLIDLNDIQPHKKEFHVSPFNPMSQNYHWRLIPPNQGDKKCLVQINAHDQNKPNTKVFDATLSLNRVPLNQTELSRVLLRTPTQTASIAIGIYWQALKLFLKRAPFYPHPNKNKAREGIV